MSLFGLLCTCNPGNRMGCPEHGPQPRENSVLCRGCRRQMTWATCAYCAECHDRGYCNDLRHAKGVEE